jgi:uncharacterized protein YggE
VRNRKNDDGRVDYSLPLAVLALFALAALLIAPRLDTTHATIDVTATANVTTTPDTASLTVAITTQNVSSPVALRENNTQTAAVIAAITGTGVPSKDVQTSAISSSQTTDNSGNPTGFSVNNTINVTTHKLGKLGSLLNTVASLGSSVQLSGITFSVTSDARPLALARARAVRFSRTMATQLLSGTASLGPVLKIVDTENTTQNVVYPYATSVSSSPKVPVEPGTQTLSVTVHVIYAIRS